MNRFKIYICSAVFILLTALKIFAPKLSDDIGNEIKAVLGYEREQTATVMDIGAALTEGNLFEVFGQKYDIPQAEKNNSKCQYVNTEHYI